MESLRATGATPPFRQAFETALPAHFAARAPWAEFPPMTRAAFHLLTAPVVADSVCAGATDEFLSAHRPAGENPST
jgi:hypothetical protein